MTDPTFDEFARSAAKQRAETAAQRVTDLRGFERVALSAGAVTGSPEWDMFLSIVEALIRRAEGRQQIAERAALAPRLVNVERVMAHRAEAAHEAAVAETLRQVLALPKLLKENGEQAAQMLASLEEKPDAA